MSDDEAQNLYSGYRGDDYFRERHGFEPWYSRAMNDGIGDEGKMLSRRNDMLSLLAELGFDANARFTVADHGGDRGQMLRDFPHADRRVFDLSGVPLEDGCTRIDHVDDVVGQFDLVLTCHVLEHVNDPESGLAEVVSLAREGGLIFIELPNEPWRRPWQPSFQKSWLNWLTRRPTALMCADFLCTGLRVSTQTVPPLGFIAVREHLQYFSLASVEQLMVRGGLEVLTSQVLGDRLIAVGRKRLS